MIYLNKPYLPSFKKYQSYLEKAFENEWLTNNGPLVQEFKIRLEEYLGVKNLLPVVNATIGLQLAYKVLDLTGNIVTTPYTFIATSSSMQWIGLTPKFIDIDGASLNLCADKVKLFFESNIKKDVGANQVSAIVPVHLYGNPCDVNAFDQLAEKYNVKVIYDAAQAFGVKIGKESVLSYGDASILSLHATKLFHSAEGGAVVFKNAEHYERASNMINFGIDPQNGEITDCGTNAKMTEVHASMGLAVLDDIDIVIKKRLELLYLYKNYLSNYVDLPLWHDQASQNAAYFPVIFSSEKICHQVFELLKDHNIQSRKYFSPSLNNVSYLKNSMFGSDTVVNDFSKRTLCLPLHFYLSEKDIQCICQLIVRVVE